MVTELTVLDRFKVLIQTLIMSQLASDEQEISRLIGEKNKQGLTDIKAGRKKLRAEHIANLKRNIPEVNTGFIYDDVGAPIIKESKDSPDVELLINELISTSDDERRMELTSQILDVFYLLKEENRKLADKLERIRNEF